MVFVKEWSLSAMWESLNLLADQAGWEWAEGRPVPHGEQRILRDRDYKVSVTWYPDLGRFLLGGPANPLRERLELAMGITTNHAVLGTLEEMSVAEPVPLLQPGRLRHLRCKVRHKSEYPRPYKVHDDLWVRSRGEFIIATKLKESKLEFLYEDTFVYLDQQGTARYLLPDFYLIDHNLYIEYWGKDDPEYLDSRQKKEAIYQTNGVSQINIEMNDLEYDIFLGKIFERLSQTHSNDARTESS